MNFLIYPDVILIWNIFINFTTLFLLSKFTNQRKNIFYYMLCATVISMLSTIIYILTYFYARYIYIPFYATTYLFMLYIFFNIKMLKDSLSLISKYIFVCITIYGCINVFETHLIAKKIFILLVFIIFSTHISTKLMYCIRNQSLYKKITIISSNKTIRLTGLVDSGNLLYSPISNKPILILDPSISKLLFPNLKSIITDYCTTGFFNYIDATNTTGVYFMPLSYQTIDCTTNLMPIFKISHIFIEQDIYKNVYAGISKTNLSKNNEYKALIGSYFYN